MLFYTILIKTPDNKSGSVNTDVDRSEYKMLKYIFKPHRNIGNIRMRNEPRKMDGYKKNKARPSRNEALLNNG